MAGQTLARADVPLPGGAEAVYEAGGLTAFRHADQLGSAPLASTTNNTVWSAVGYAPYGEPFSSTGSDRSFTGKKADINGDQYDFLMREYNPTLGRWWTPDPAGLTAVDPNDPQSWNKYSYMQNAPTEGTDPLGLWPFYGHDAMYEAGLGGTLSKSDLRIIEEASYEMDYAPGQQDPTLSFEHSMSDGVPQNGQPPQTPEQAMEAAANFINTQLQEAAQAQKDWQALGGAGYSFEALVHFANAAHTLTDATSPAHRGFQPWTGKHGGEHLWKEKLPNHDQVRAGGSLVAEAFLATFPTGFDPETDYTPPKAIWVCVEVVGQGKDCHWEFE